MSWDKKRGMYCCDRCGQIISLSMKNPYVTVAKYDFEGEGTGVQLMFCGSCKPLVFEVLQSLCSQPTEGDAR